MVAMGPAGSRLPEADERGQSSPPAAEPIIHPFNQRVSALQGVEEGGGAPGHRTDVVGISVGGTNEPQSCFDRGDAHDIKRPFAVHASEVSLPLRPRASARSELASVVTARSGVGISLCAAVIRLQPVANVVYYHTQNPRLQIA